MPVQSYDLSSYLFLVLDKDLTEHSQEITSLCMLFYISCTDRFVCVRFCGHQFTWVSTAIGTTQVLKWPHSVMPLSLFHIYCTVFSCTEKNWGWIHRMCDQPHASGWDTQTKGGKCSTKENVLTVVVEVYGTLNCLFFSFL